jgi:hypothetical protein
MLVVCLAFLAARVGGLHFHVSDHDLHPVAAANEVGHHHGDSHLTSELADDHLAGHVSDGERDVSADTGLMAKLPTSALPLAALALWLAFAWSSRLSLGRRVPIEWLRPPPLYRWPATLLPPSQGPPRAI